MSDILSVTAKVHNRDYLPEAASYGALDRSMGPAIIYLMKSFMYGIALISGLAFRVCAGEPVFGPVSMSAIKDVEGMNVPLSGYLALAG